MKRLQILLILLALIWAGTSSPVGSTWPASKIAGNLNLGAGTLRGGVSVETTGSTGTEAAAEGQWIFVTAAATRTLPAVSPSDQSLCYYTTTAAVLTIDPAGSDPIVLDGTVQTGGVTIVSSAVAGERICLLSNGTNWYEVGMTGTWAAGS